MAGKEKTPHNFLFVETITGTACDFNSELLTFILMEEFLTFHVYLPLHMTTNAVSLFGPNEIISIKNLYLYDNTHLFLTQNSKINKHETSKFVTENKLVELFRKFPTLQAVKRFYLDYPEIEFKELNVSSTVMKIELFEKLERKEDVVKISTPKSFRFSSQKTSNFHAVLKNETNEVLVAYLGVDKFGSLCLCHENVCIPCIAICKNNDEIWYFIYKLVFLKKFSFVKEFYNDGNNKEYFVVYKTDFKLICENNIPNRTLSLLLRRPPLTGYNIKYNFVIVKIAKVNTSQHSFFECWLEVLILRNEEWVKHFLCIPQFYFEILPVLDVGNVYCLWTKEQMFNYSDPEIKRICSKTPSLKLSPNVGIFVRVRNIKPPSINVQIMTVEEALKSQEAEINFSTSDLNKQYVVQNFSSRTLNTHKMCGTPTKLQHILYLGTRYRSELKMYLNNWERKLYPYGLLPKMEITVLNALYIKRQYIKANHFTTFKVTNYYNEVTYNGTDLYREMQSQKPRRVLHEFPLSKCMEIKFPDTIFSRVIFRCYNSFSLKYINDNKITAEAEIEVFDSAGVRIILSVKRFDVIKYLLIDTVKSYKDIIFVMKKIKYFSMSEVLKSSLEGEDLCYFDNMLAYFEAQFLKLNTFYGICNFHKTTSNNVLVCELIEVVKIHLENVSGAFS